jgi:hypothetical protein
MKAPFKLYWVETPSPEENCFVAARSKTAAARHEENCTGFNPGDCSALYERDLNQDWVATKYRDESEPIEKASAFYVLDEALAEVGVTYTIVDGDDLYQYGEQEFLKQGDMNYLSSLGDEPKNIVIRNVSDLLEILERDAPGHWIFRGHSSCKWELSAGVHRNRGGARIPDEEMVLYEQRLLGEFKRRARAFLSTPPNSDWEWLVLAQHFGLPTRLLDWTENPLVALYFAVSENDGWCDDGMLYAYRHSAPEIDIHSSTDPFAITRVELVRPPHLDQRVIVQQSVFTAEPRQIVHDEKRDRSDLRYWNVSGIAAAEIKEELLKLGISRSTLFPGLEALAADIRSDGRLRPNASLSANPCNPSNDNLGAARKIG